MLIKFLKSTKFFFKFLSFLYIFHPCWNIFQFKNKFTLKLIMCNFFFGIVYLSHMNFNLLIPINFFKFFKFLLCIIIYSSLPSFFPQYCHADEPCSLLGLTIKCVLNMQSSSLWSVSTKFYCSSIIPFSIWAHFFFMVIFRNIDA